MKLIKELEHLLADTYAVYLKTQNFHWNVKGPQFFSLHLLLEKQYTEMAEAVDEIAERVQALGSYVCGSFSDFQKLTCIKDAKSKQTAKQMLQQLVKDHQILIKCAQSIAKKAEVANDFATGDLMARRLGAHEKFCWMLRSHLSG